MLRRALPVATLVVLAPVVAELLAGTVPVWQITNLLFFLPIYGAGALLIRELVRRQGRGWPSILLLGAAYGLIEEGLVSQAMFSPTLYGVAAWSPRLFGINLDYTEVVLPLHAIWSAAAPIALVELAFPTRSMEPWLGRLGAAVAVLFYLLGVGLLAYGTHTQLDPGFWAPPPLLGLSGLMAVGLGVLALWVLPRTARAQTRRGRAPSPWLILLAGFLGAFAFLGLLIPLGGAQQPAATQGNFVAAPMLAAVGVAAVTIALLRRWTTVEGWGDRHRLALVSGALIAHTLIFGLTHTSPAEQLGLAGLCVAMVAGLAVLASVIARRTRQTTRAPSRILCI